MNDRTRLPHTYHVVIQYSLVSEEVERPNHASYKTQGSLGSDLFEDVGSTVEEERQITR